MHGFHSFQANRSAPRRYKYKYTLVRARLLQRPFWFQNTRILGTRSGFIYVLLLVPRGRAGSRKAWSRVGNRLRQPTFRRGSATHIICSAAGGMADWPLDELESLLGSDDLVSTLLGDAQHQPFNASANISDHNDHSGCWGGLLQGHLAKCTPFLCSVRDKSRMPAAFVPYDNLEERCYRWL